MENHKIYVTYVVNLARYKYNNYIYIYQNNLYNYDIYENYDIHKISMDNIIQIHDMNNN